MHQIHAKGEFGKAVDPSGSLLDATEQQEGTEDGKQHIGCAELPRPFHHWCLLMCTRI